MDDNFCNLSSEHSDSDFSPELGHQVVGDEDTEKNK